MPILVLLAINNFKKYLVLLVSNYNFVVSSIKWEYSKWDYSIDGTEKEGDFGTFNHNSLCTENTKSDKTITIEYNKSLNNTFIGKMSVSNCCSRSM
jgi:hypothetical protein